MKKMSFLLFAAFVTCSITTHSAFAASFADVPETSPYHVYIEDLRTLGVTDGITPGQYGPEQTLTRAQFAKFAASAFGLKDPGGTSTFPDIRGHWAEPYIRAATQAGIVEGTSAATFSPDQPVRREEAASMVWRYARNHGLTVGPEVAFSDKPKAWALEAVNTAIGHRWFGPDVSQTASGWSYRPHDTMTRQEMAALLDSALKELTAPKTPVAAAAAPADRSQKKATYVWNTGNFLQNKSEVLQYLKQHQINLIFLQVDIDVPASQYADFIREAGIIGMDVHAMGGAPNWILPDNQPKMYKLIDWVKTYNAGSGTDARFKGIHLDVEPFTMPIWTQQSDTLLGNWRDTISGFVQQTKEGTPDLIAGAALPSWLEQFNVPDGQGGRSTLSEWMIRQLDQTTLMAYRDTSEEILSSIMTEMDQADRDGKSVIIAVETKPSNEGPITFYTKGQAVMMQELGNVTDMLQKRPSFSGWAIHEYDSWIHLKE
jgi:hypothetical protein